MSNTLKNLLIILGVITISYAGYYLYTSRSFTTSSGPDDAEYQAMLTRTQAFITRSQELNQMRLDFSVFEESAFSNLQSYSLPEEDITAGRSNPFAEVSGG